MPRGACSRACRCSSCACCLLQCVDAACGRCAGRAPARRSVSCRACEGLQAQFKQTLTDRNGQIARSSRAARWRSAVRTVFAGIIASRTSRSIVADGTRIWLYDSDLEQVTVRKLDDTLSATPAMLLSGEGQSRGQLQRHADRAGGRRRNGCAWNPSATTPISNGCGSASPATTLKFMQLADKLGQTTTLEFSKLERNPPLDPSRFTFTVPPGADVIGDASGARRRQAVDCMLLPLRHPRLWLVLGWMLVALAIVVSLVPSERAAERRRQRQVRAHRRLCAADAVVCRNLSALALLSSSRIGLFVMGVADRMGAGRDAPRAARPTCAT